MGFFDIAAGFCFTNLCDKRKPKMKTSQVHPMELCTGRKDGKYEDLEWRFIVALRSIGYPDSEIIKLAKKFDISAKVTTIVSLQNVEGKKEFLKEVIGVLSKRHSLMHLLFVREILEGRRQLVGENNNCPPASNDSLDETYDLTIGRERLLFQLLMKSSPQKLVKFSLSSTNEEFLKNFVELLVFIMKVHGEDFHVLSEVLAKSSYLGILRVVSYITFSKETEPLYETAVVDGKVVGCSYLELIVSMVLRMKEIKCELDFVFLKRCKVPSNLMSVDKMRYKFQDRKSYEKLCAYITEENIKHASRQVLIKRSSTPPPTDELRGITKDEVKRLLEGLKKYKTLTRALEVELMSTKKRLSDMDIKIKDLEYRLHVEREKNAKLITSVEHTAQKDPLVTKISLPVEAKEDTSVCKKITPNLKSFDKKPNNVQSKAPNDIKAVLPIKTRAPAERSGGVTRRGEKTEVPKSKFSDKKYVGIAWRKAPKDGIFQKIDSFRTECLFSFSDFTNFEDKKVVGSVSNEKQKETPTPAGCIEPRKALSLNIALSRIKESDEELVEAILKKKLDNQSLVNQLVIFFPSYEELKAIEDAKVLSGRAETLFKAVKNYKVFKDALLSLRFKFAITSQNYHEEISKLDSAYTEILESSELVQLFSCILAVGNILNVNKYSGNASGFSIDSLKGFKNPEILRAIIKHIDLKALNNETSLSQKVHKSGLSLESLERDLRDIKGMFIEGSISPDVVDEYECLLSKVVELKKKHQSVVDYFGDKFTVVMEYLCEIIEAMNKLAS